MTLSGFKKQQRQHLSGDLLPKLLKLYQEIAKDLRRACKRSLRNFLSANGFVDDDDFAFQYTHGGAEGFDDFDALDDMREREEQQAAQIRIVQLGATMGSSPDGKQQANKDAAKSYTERATTRTQCRKLAKFIRLIQAQFEAAVAAAAQATSLQFLKVLKNRDRARPLFVVECVFNAGNTGDELAIADKQKSGGGSPKKRGVSVAVADDDAVADGHGGSRKKKAGVSIGGGGGGAEFGISFSPSRHDFKVEVGGVIGRALAAVAALPRLQDLHEFETYIAGVTASAASSAQRESSAVVMPGGIPLSSAYGASASGREKEPLNIAALTQPFFK